MTVTHLSECGQGKLKNWHVIPANSGNPECLVIATRLQLRAKRGRGEADAAIQQHPVIAITSDLPACWLSRLAITNHLATVFWLLSGMASRSTSSSIRRRSRRGNPDGLKMHLGLAGLLHFVRNDGKGVVNYGSINNQPLETVPDCSIGIQPVIIP